MRYFRFSSTESKEATGAGCLLALLACVATLAACLALGPRVVRRVTPVVAWVGRRPATVLVSAVMILPGLLLFWGGAALMKRLGIPVWREGRHGRGHVTRRAGRRRGGRRPG